MVNPVLIAKAAAIALSDERLRMGIGWIMVAILSPIIVVIALLCGILSGVANHNITALDLSFNGGAIAGKVPAEYREHIEDMRKSFALLDGTITLINGQMEASDRLDSVRVKAIFYSLYFGAEQPSMIDRMKYVNCFVTYAERTRTVTKDDGSTSKDIYTVTVPINDLSVVYKNIESVLGKTAAYEDMANAREIYYRMTYGIPAPLEDDSTQGWDSWTYQLTAEEMKNLYHDLPIGKKRTEIVKYAMSRLGDPYSQEKRGQGRYTDCSYLSMWCYKKIGISIPKTAAEQARFCVNNGLTIAKKDLAPGDLVFWSHKPNGRFMNITHVGIYAGGGKVVDASYSKCKVVYRNLFDSNKQVLYGRPYATE